MYTLRCAVALEHALRQISAEVEPGAHRPTTRLGDWAVYRKRFGTRPVLLAVSEVTLLPVVLWAAPIATAPVRLRTAVGAVLTGLGVPAPSVRAELAEMELLVRGRIHDRRVRGTLNEFVHMARWHAVDAPMEPDLVALSLHLSVMPCGARGYAAPADLTRALFGIAAAPAGLS